MVKCCTKEGEMIIKNLYRFGEEIALLNYDQDIKRSQSVDFYLMDELLSDEERSIRNKVRAFCDKEVIPIINDYWERAAFPFELVPRLAALNIAGGSIQGYGCPGMSSVATGLIALELA